MSEYSTYDVDGFPFIPNTDSYMSKECREIGFPAEREAAAELELLNDFGPSDSDFIVQDIYLCLYEKPHAKCFKSCTERLAGAV